jgi:hypothetical protein
VRLVRCIAAGAMFYFVRDLNFIVLKKLRQGKREQAKA